MKSKIVLFLIFIAIVFFLGCTQNNNAANRILDPKPCESQSSDARDSCYFLIGANNKDLTICDKIVSDCQKDLCYSTVKNVPSTKYDSTCQPLSPNTQVKDQNLSWEECSKIPAGGLSVQFNCFMKIIESKNDSTLCEKLTRDYNNMDYCYFRLARKNKDSSLCSEIVEQTIKDDCLAIATLKPTEEFCEKIITPQYKGRCYGTIGVNSNDKNICNKLTDSITKESCEIWYSLNK